MTGRLTKLTATMADALAGVAPADEAEWRKVRVVTVELEVTADGQVTYAHGWLEKWPSSKALGLARGWCGTVASRAPRCQESTSAGSS